MFAFDLLVSGFHLTFDLSIYGPVVVEHSRRKGVICIYTDHFNKVVLGLGDALNGFKSIRRRR